MYDQTNTRVMTGKLTRYVPGANHAQLIFQVLDDEGKPTVKDGKPVTWGVETGSAAAMSRRGVTPETFPEGRSSPCGSTRCETGAISAPWRAC